MEPPGAEVRGWHPDDRNDPSIGSEGSIFISGNLTAKNRIEGIHECYFSFDWSYPDANFKYITHYLGYRTYPGEIACHLVIREKLAIKIECPVRIEWGD